MQKKPLSISKHAVNSFLQKKPLKISILAITSFLLSAALCSSFLYASILSRRNIILNADWYLSVGSVFEWYLYPENIALIIAGACISLLVLLVMQHNAVLKKMSAELARANKQAEEVAKTKITELENELLQNQISIMLSQIRPHFLYNSLVAIQELCLIDPETAREAINEFSSYLRGNLSAFAVTKPIPFDQELRHVESYLSLERKRYGDKLNIEYDISIRDFNMPIQTLQPLVENAVRHGVTKREEGGTVTVKTAETETDIIISVIDDGVGINAINEFEDSDRTHVGIDNVTKRLISMCNGTLSIESIPGEGTTAVITIPKAEKDDKQA